MNALCFHNVLNTNTIPYQLRMPKLEQPLFRTTFCWEHFLWLRTTRYGLRTFSYSSEQRGMGWEHFPMVQNNEVWTENIFLWLRTRYGLRTFSYGSEQRGMGWENFPMAQNNEVWAENIFLWLRTTRYGLRTFSYGSEQQGMGWEHFPMAQNNEVWAENIFLWLRTTRYGLRTISYVSEQRVMGWEHFPMSDLIYGILFLNDHDDIVHIDFDEFKPVLNTSKGPDILQYAIPLLWWLPVLRVVSLWYLSCIGFLYRSIYW